MKKALIIPGGLHMGGAERVAANVGVFAPEGEFEFHYLVFEGYDNVYGPEIERHGGKIITVPSPSAGYGAYIKTLSKLIRENHYCAVHSHTMFNSGINLVAAKLNGVPVRIGHSHTTRTETKVSFVQKTYEKIMRMLILWSATDLLACGVEAGEWMFGTRAFSKLGHVIHNGIDTDAFAYSVKNREAIRRQYGFAPDDFVIGHSGTLIPLKNQAFLIRILPAIRELLPNARLMFLGNGEEAELQRLQQIAEESGISDRVTFCGGVMNANEHLSAMDVFAFPSLREGTPLALIEAQANGLPCVISANIPDDAIITDLISVFPLEDCDAWVRALVHNRRRNPGSYADAVSAAGYSIKSSFDPLYKRLEGRPLQKRPAVSLSFDDARGDNTYVFETILKKYGLPATLNVTTGYVDGSCPDELCPSSKPAMTNEEVVRLWKSGMVELALHGDQHLNTVSDSRECRQKLNAWLDLPDDTAYGFASPGSGMTIEAFQSPEFRDFRSSVLYMRTSLRIRSMKAIRVLCRKAGRVIHLPLLYRIAYADTIMHFRDGKIVYSVPVMKDATLAQVKKLVQLCIKQNGNLTLMFHSILPDTSKEDNWTWSQEKFESLCVWLKEQINHGDLEVLTTAQLYEQMEH